MNKKERKAAAVLKAAQLIAAKKVAVMSAPVSDNVSVGEKKVERPKYSVPPMEFPEGRYGKYNAFEIIKEKKGRWSVRMQTFAFGVIQKVERRFKSWYSARVWCLLHKK